MEKLLLFNFWPGAKTYLVGVGMILAAADRGRSLIPVDWPSTSAARALARFAQGS